MNVMIICENRELLKQIYSCVANEKQYKIFIVSFSLNAVEEFVKRKPSIVILDEDTVIPFQTILEQLDEWKWDYKAVILSSSESNNNVVDDKKRYLCKNHIVDEELLLSIGELLNIDGNKSDLDSIQEQNMSFELDNIVFKRDIYMILAIQYFNSEKVIPIEEKVEKIKKTAELFGQAEVLYSDESTIIILMGKSKMKAFSQWNQISETLIRSCGKECTIFVSNNIPWNKMASTYTQLENILDYSYFYKGQVVYANEIKNRKAKVRIEDINKELVLILDCIFSKKNKELEARLNEFLMNVICKSLDFNAIKYLRRIINILEKFFYSMVNKEYSSNDIECFSIEDELKSLVMRYTQLAEIMSERKFSLVVKNAILYVVDNYKEDISLDSLTEEIGVTKVYLSRIFKEETKITFLEFLQAVRMQAAKHYIVNTDLKIHDIAKKVGYMDAHYFSRLFKKRQKYSPENYKKLVKELGNESII